MGSVVLGKMVLSWCHECNLPVVGRTCDICSTKTEKVKCTPPGDIRPAFGPDLIPIRNIIDKQFGDGCGQRLIPSGNVVILNRVPDQDRMEEIIVAGHVVGNLKFIVGSGYKFILKQLGALRLLPHLEMSWVKVDDEAAVFIRKSTSVLAPGVMEAHEDIQPGDEVVVFSESGDLIGSGTARCPGPEMVASNHGLSVRLRQKWKDSTLPENYDKSGDWDLVIQANERTLQRYEQESVSFIHRTISQHPDHPVMVSLSGGKDSLAVLLLLLAAGERPGLLFLDTGLEFPETIENVHRTAEHYDLPLVIANAGNAFWKALPQFGPPAKDHRWCCKVCKLGPTARKIMETYPEGVLSFIGQRAYESMQRARKPRVWENPWVPGQIGASPIQNWTALHIWLYIFSKGAEYNPLYELGLSRIGCWLCPASDQADFLDIQKVHPDGDRWNEYLLQYAKGAGLSDEWVKYGLWKWKTPPGFVKDLMEQKGIEFKLSNAERNDQDELSESNDREGSPSTSSFSSSTSSSSSPSSSSSSSPSSSSSSSSSPSFSSSNLTFLLGEVYPSCTDEITAQGIFTRPLDIQREERLLSIIALTIFDPQTNTLSVGPNVNIMGEGTLSVQARDKETVLKLLGTVIDVTIRTEECVGCGICIARCPHEALFLDSDGRVDLKKDRCVHCRKCLGKCPVTDFRGDREFEI